MRCIAMSEKRRVCGVEHPSRDLTIHNELVCGFYLRALRSGSLHGVA